MNKKIIIIAGIIALIVVAYFIVDSLLFDGVRPRAINENGFQANYCTNNNKDKTTAIVLVGGGQWGDYWAQEFVKKQYVGLSLPYIGNKALPELPEEIDLEYFEKAIKWLMLQPEVEPKKIIVMGASRNAELALLIASTFPKLINGVVAYSPSSVSWSNTVLPYNSNEIKASWKYKGVDVPYVPMTKIEGNNSDKIETLDYWKSGLKKTEYLAKAMIKVEKINGPILLFSGNDDAVWPSSIMADMIEQRLIDSNFKFPIENIKYKNAGHLISSHPELNSDVRYGIMTINGKDYKFDFGGTFEGDKLAKKDAKKRLMEFLEKI